MQIYGIHGGNPRSNQTCYNYSESTVKNIGSLDGWRLGHGWKGRWLRLSDGGFGDFTLRPGLGYEEISFSRIYIFDLVVCFRVEWPRTETTGACMSYRRESKE